MVGRVENWENRKWKRDRKRQKLKEGRKKKEAKEFMTNPCAMLLKFFDGASVFFCGSSVLFIGHANH